MSGIKTGEFSLEPLLNPLSGILTKPQRVSTNIGREKNFHPSQTLEKIGLFPGNVGKKQGLFVWYVSQVN